MATYAVGDIQGCFGALLSLLDKINFNWQKDKLWLCGDLVNRGPQSLNTLQYLYEYQDRIRLVLGNHDLHLLAQANGVGEAKSKDTFHNILLPENKHLIEWLYRQPLAHYSDKHRWLMVHAGISPTWSLKTTLKLSAEISSVLSNPKLRPFYFANMYGNYPNQWDKNLQGSERWRYITNVFTRMRFCYKDGSLDLSCKVAPGNQPKNLKPWFKLPLKLEKDTGIIFGHWAALEGKLANQRFQALDTGKVWGGKLTAFNLKSGERVSV